jgi:hypothetical protein
MSCRRLGGSLEEEEEVDTKRHDGLLNVHV